MRNIISIIFILTLTCFAQSPSESSVITSITSTNLVVGELAALDLTYRDARPSSDPPQRIEVDGLTVVLRGNQQQCINGDRYYTYRYVITSASPGSYTIPSLVLPHKGQSSQTLEIPINIHSTDVLERFRAEYKDRDIIYYAKLFPAKTSLYPGEATALEYKIYLPNNTYPQGWGLPKPTEMQNCTAWRFDPPSNSGSTGNVTLDGQQYSVGTYSTVLTALQAGTALFGPIETDLTIAPATVRPQWGFMRKTVQLPLPYDAVEFEVKDFPSQAPAEFKGAVGDFSIEASLPTKESIGLNESITATVTVIGSGNLPQVKAPSLEDTATWKVVDVSRVEQGDERKSLNGVAEFNYILQPQRGAEAFPRFTFSHFNPETAQFYTETTETAPLSVISTSVTGSSTISAADVPTGQMNDILAPIAEIDLGATSPRTASTIPVWLWQIIPAGILLLLVARSFQEKAKGKALKDSEKTIRLRAFQQLETSTSEDFLKEAGAYIERWHREGRPAELDAILEQRDSQCYQPETAQSSSEKQRKAVLDALKKFLILTLSFAALLSSRAHAADGFDLWLEGDYKHALETYEKQLEQHPYSADLEYNIGSCYYRLSQPGKAALHYQRALAIEPKHVEAQTNLDFTQKMQGSIVPESPTGIRLWASSFNAGLFLQLTFAFLWITVLSAVALAVLKWKTGKMAALIAAVVIAPCLAAFSIYTWSIHPDKYRTNEGQPAILTQFSAVLTEPIKVSGKELEKKTLINATPASPCTILAVRGEWAYLELSNAVRGWVPKEKVSPIQTAEE